MADLFTNLTVGGRTYIRLLFLDADGRRAQLRVRDVSNPPWNTRVVQPYACADCAAFTIDPAVHNEAHDGPACRVCGCTEDDACPGGCHWVDDHLCSACGEPAEPEPVVVDLVGALRASVEAARARRAGSVPEGEVQR